MLSRVATTGRHACGLESESQSNPGRLFPTALLEIDVPSLARTVKRAGNDARKTDFADLNQKKHVQRRNTRPCTDASEPQFSGVIKLEKLEVKSFWCYENEVEKDFEQF